MKELLNYLCDTLDPIQRRLRLQAILTSWFPNRVILQQKRVWSRDEDYIDDTVNFIIPFGDCRTPQNAKYLSVGAHYDAVPHCPGANDNGAAVVQLLLAAKALDNKSLEPNVEFVFFDHEEHYGSTYMGSKLYVKLKAEESRPLPDRALVWDVSGIGDVFYYSGNGVHDDGSGLCQDLPFRHTPPSDNLNLERVGIPTTLICALPENEFSAGHPDTWSTLHSMEDSPEKVWESTLYSGAALIEELIGRYERQVP